MKPQALLMIVLGLLIGPGYYAFCEQISGRPGQSYALTERADRWTLPDGSILRSPSGLAYKPVALELTPESNGYRLRFGFNVTQGDAAADATNNYQVSLMQGDIGVIERGIQVKGRGAVAVVLDTLQVSYSSSYLLVLAEVGKPPLSVSGVSLQIDTDVEKPRMWVAGIGLVLLVLGIGMQLREVFVQAPKR